MNLPCEIIVSDILPRVRSILAKELVSRGHSQVKTARLMGITQPAVSQYLKEARSRKVSAVETPEIKGKIRRIADNLEKGGNVVLEICRLCLFLKKKKMLCKIHREKTEVPEGCSICFSGGKCDCSD